MNGRWMVRVLATLVAIAIVIGIGTMVYNAGVTAGLSEAAVQAAASGEAVPVNPGGWGYGYGGPYVNGPGGFGFFGILFLFFGIWLTIGLVRMAVGGGIGRGSGPGGWGDRRDRVEEWHRELHRRDDRSGEQRAAGA